MCDEQRAYLCYHGGVVHVPTSAIMAYVLRACTSTLINFQTRHLKIERNTGIAILLAILPALLWAGLNIFKYSAISLAIFSYFEGKLIIYNLING